MSTSKIALETRSDNRKEPASGWSKFRGLVSMLQSTPANQTSSFAGKHVDHAVAIETEVVGENQKLELVTESAEVNLDQYYVPIDNFEGRHRYDPRATWSNAEETALVRRLDLRICAWCCLIFFALQLDRGNIGQALSDNMLKDLGLNTNDYNTGQTIFYLSFLAAELPSQLVSKKIGPENWIPIQMISWSIVACCQARLTGRTSFFVTRSLLGIIEGGFIPDMVLYLSYYYTSKELPIRLSFFWGAYGVTFIVSAFLAYGILHLRGYEHLAGWQWLFALEGALTALLGIISWFHLPPSPYQTASRFRGRNGWFTEREEIIMANRIIRDDPSKGDMHNRQAVTWRLLWQALKDYDMWPMYLLGLTWTIPNESATSYLTLILKSLNFSTFETNLLTVPAYVLFVLQLVFWTWVSERINNRYLINFICQIYMLPLLVGLETLPGGLAYVWKRYTLNTMLVGFPAMHAVNVAMTSRNAGSVRTRTVGTALYNMCVQASHIIASNIYRDNDKPLYRTGNVVLLSLVGYVIIVIISSKLYYIWRNTSRDRIWQSMSDVDRAHYLRTTTDQGNKRLKGSIFVLFIEIRDGEVDLRCNSARERAVDSAGEHRASTEKHMESNREHPKKPEV